VCNYDSEINISESEESVTSVINSKNEETEALVSDARAKRPRLEDLGDWQLENFYNFCCHNNNQLSEIGVSVQSARSASEAFNMYFDDFITGATVTETTGMLRNSQTKKDKLILWNTKFSNLYRLKEAI
jgi:hypothetical protein